METDRKENESVGTITVPDGKELKSIRVFCSKHGDVSDACIGVQTTSQKITGEKTIKPNIYCIECLNDLLESFQKDGLIGKIALIPVVESKKS